MHDAYFLLHAALTALMLAACYTDARRYRIPNALVGLVLLLYPVMVLTSSTPVPWLEGLIAFVAVFVVTFAMFNAGVMGGGDTKLLSACALWTGTQATLAFLVWMSLIGGVLTLLLLIARRMLRSRAERLPPVLVKGGKVPYGIAIALGFLLVLWQGQVPGLPVPWMATLIIE